MTRLSDGPAALSDCDCVLFPILTPENRAELLNILPNISPHQPVFGGKFDTECYEAATASGLSLHDYLLREELAVANAVPTAEGALQLAMEHLPITIRESRVLISGFGRVGQCTARCFRALGANVAVLARAPGQLALAESMGCRAIALKEFSSSRHPFDLILNTIPAPIFGFSLLNAAGSPILMELASPPGGFDLDAVAELGLRLIPAPGLPGKVAPLTAARIIQKTIYRMLEEFDL